MFTYVCLDEPWKLEGDLWDNSYWERGWLQMQDDIEEDSVLHVLSGF